MEKLLILPEIFVRDFFWGNIIDCFSDYLTGRQADERFKGLVAPGIYPVTGFEKDRNREGLDQYL